MFTKSLTLTAEQISLGSCGNGTDAAACLLGYVVGLPALTFVVSGGVVLAGNSLHWLEFHGTCDSGYINLMVSEFKKSNNT